MLRHDQDADLPHPGTRAFVLPPVNQADQRVIVRCGDHQEGSARTQQPVLAPFEVLMREDRAGADELVRALVGLSQAAGRRWERFAYEIAHDDFLRLSRGRFGSWPRKLGLAVAGGS